MKILALDLGKYKTVGCDYEAETGKHRFRTSLTTRAGLAQLVKEVQPDRVVIEVCNLAGWVCDLLRELGVGDPGSEYQRGCVALAQGEEEE